MTNMSICVNLETGLIVFVDDRDIIIFVHRRVFLKKKKKIEYILMELPKNPKQKTMGQKYP